MPAPTILQVQNPYGRTPLHIAASVGAVRTCDGIVAATTAGVNRTDMFGTTALDNARSKGQAAVEAIIIARGGLSGDDPRVQKEHEDVREFIETNNKHEMVRRKTRILDGLPEAKLRHTLLCVVSALQNFMEVCSSTANHNLVRACPSWVQYMPAKRTPEVLFNQLHVQTNHVAILAHFSDFTLDLMWQ